MKIKFIALNALDIVDIRIEEVRAKAQFDNVWMQTLLQILKLQRRRIANRWKIKLIKN